MPQSARPKRHLSLPLAAPADSTAAPLPDALTRPASRAGGAAPALLPGVTVKTRWNLAPAARSGDAPVAGQTAADEKLLALEASDGTTVFIRADKLADDLARLRPELVGADGAIDLAGFRDREGASRGLGDWLWRRVSELEISPDGVAEAAQAKLHAWLAELALGKAAEKLTQDQVTRLSTLGARALMAAIEDKLAGPPGLYQWNGRPLGAGDFCPPGDGRLTAWGDQPALVFIHGTGSHTLGSFGDLGSSPDWAALTQIFGDRIFGFEHPSFSVSPVANALALAEALPKNAQLCLVTHSRGGLVGDLMCLGTYSTDAQALVAAFRRTPRPDELEAEEGDASGTLTALREKQAAAEQAQLARLYAVLAEKNFTLRRYVRVACPAAGTALLSDNLEVFLSGLLNLARKAASWGAGGLAGAASGGLAAGAAEQAVGQGLAFLSRVVLEIARSRLQPQLVPGIEAMLPDSPLGSFLARAGRRPGVAMAVIAGDIEGGGVLKRIGVMFTDWMFFDQVDNDLVVDTASMYAGLARDGASALFDQGPEVNHFHYFKNPRTRGALRAWLVEKDTTGLAEWTALPTLLAARAAASRSEAPPPADNTRPVLIYIPGIMGSNLEVRRRKPGKAGSGDRVWLDFLDLAGGGLKDIGYDQEGVFPDDVVDLAYGKLARHLEKNHRVIRHAYDWRQSNITQGAELAKVVEAALAAHPDQPLRILAHSMGGLVTRAMIAQRPDLWEAIVARPGGRLVMLGTPNHGSHLMVETLLGKSDTLRMLARLDLTRGLQPVLDIVAGFPGALQLLPQPGFVDASGPAARDWLAADVWPPLTEFNNDYWFGKKLGGKPCEAHLTEARKFWELVSGEPAGDPAQHRGGARPIPHLERIAYVFGQAPNTPCGMEIIHDSEGQPLRIQMLGTPKGDGSVSWASGRLDWLAEDHYWTIPADHSGMVNSEDHFGAIEELVVTGRTSLARLPASRGQGVAPLRHYNAKPMPGYPSEQDLVATLLGGQPRPPRPKGAQVTLAVAVRAADLRFIHIPVLCGHYLEDPIGGAERIIDQALVDGALTQRARMGVHAGALGSASVVLMPRRPEEVLRGTGRGALVVGLGEFGELRAGDITETVRAGVLRLLLHAADAMTEADNPDRAPLALRLASLLIGYNSTTHISVDESVAAIALGVLEANHQFAIGLGKVRPPVTVAALEFVELYQDVALTAARAVADLPRTLGRSAQALGASLQPARELIYGDGVRPRLSVASGASYWPRLMITDAEPERATAQAGPRYPEQLRFLYLSERARAEAVVQQRQPGLVEKLVAAEISSTAYTPELGIGRTLFHLLVPLDFKATAREAGNLLLVVDSYTANLPWEMLVADGEPLVTQARMVRQLASTRFRPAVHSTRQASAYVVRNPSTQGYFREFGGARPMPAPEDDHLKDLPGAEAEGDAVAALLEGQGYRVTHARGGSEAADVIGKLFQQPYRILVIAAHGVFQVVDRQGAARSGVVLSDGILLTAAEVGQMEVVPELVFLSCCNLGRTDGDLPGHAPNRLAYSLARELIEMGVRCVVAAGWEVDDEAAKTFSTTFFDRFVGHNLNFGQALFEARRACYEGHREHNTWGAYQAYGDPAFTLGEQPSAGSGQDSTLLAPVELLDWLASLRLDARNLLDEGPADAFRKMAAWVQQRLRGLPPAWLERPDVQQALGALYAEFGEAGYDAARAALLTAIAADTTLGVVPLATVEQLANLEARSATALADLKLARSRVDQAIARLEHLLELTAGAPAGLRPNTERWSLLGSAYKRRADILAKAGKPWAEIAKDLTRARDAYAQGEGDPTAPGFNPYATLNRLQLEAVLGSLAPDWEERLQRCQAAAHQRFAQSFDFWDAAIPLDGDVARAVRDGSLPDHVAALADQYQKRLAHVAASPRQRDSLLRQIELMARFLDRRGEARLAAALGQLAAALGGEAPVAPGTGAAPQAPRTGQGRGRRNKAKPAG